MNTPAPVRDYVLKGLAGTPLILARLLDFPAEDPRWDRRLAPDRFSLREMVAHLADWDPIFQERLDRMLKEENPFLLSIDEGVIAVERDYGGQNPCENLARIAISRPKLVAAFEKLPDEEWARAGHREFVGDIDVFGLAVMVLGHDAYHLRQAAESIA